MQILGLSLITFTVIVIAIIGFLITVNISTSSSYTDGEEGMGFYSSLIFIAFIAAMFYFEPASFNKTFNMIKENIFSFILYTLGYFSLGVLWSFYKWYLLVKTKKEKFIKEKLDFPNKKHNSVKKPIPSDYATTLTMWIIYWPFSSVWFIMSNPIMNIGNYLRKKFSGFYSKISNSAWEEIESEKNNS